MNKIKVVVTGGLGFIGSHITDALIEAGYEVHVVDNMTRGSKVNLNKKAILHVIDIRNLTDLVSVFENTIYVFHEAAYPEVEYSIKYPTETNEINVQGTLNVLEAARMQKVKRVILASSCAVYGDPQSLPVKETSKLNPLSPYGAQKLTGEIYAKLYADLFNLGTICLRYFNVYGTRQRAEGAYASVISKFISLKKLNLPLTITGDGSQTRDFVSVKDVVRANILAMKSEKVGAGDIVNIGGGQSYSVNQIAELVGGSVVYIDSRTEPKDSLADITLAHSLLNWKPEVSLKEGIQDLVKEI